MEDDPTPTPLPGPVVPPPNGGPDDPLAQFDWTIIPDTSAVLPVEGDTPSPTVTIFINGLEYAADQIMVKFQSFASQTDRQAVCNQYGLTQLAYFSLIDSYLLSVPAGTSVSTLKQSLDMDPRVQLSELNGVGQGGSTPVDQYYAALQWPLVKMGMPNAWNRTIGNSSHIIAVLDSGVKSDHPDLNPKLYRNASNQLFGFNQVGSGYPNDDHGHGTFVSGIAAAQTTFPPAGSGTGIAGVSPLGRILPVKVLNSSNSGTHAQLTAGIQNALTIPGVKIMSASLRGYGYNSQTDAAIKAAIAKDVLFVTITGNIPQGDNGQSYPGSYWHTMAISATTSLDQRALYSNTGEVWSGGSSFTQNAVAAPGGAGPGDPGSQVFSTTRVTGPYGDYYGYFGWGTSYAAPHVAGLAEIVSTSFPTMSWYDLKYRIEDTADNVDNVLNQGYDQYVGWGRVNGDKATTPKSLASYSFPQNAAYRLISLPVWPSNLSQTDKTTDPAILFPGANALVVWWDPQAGVYRPYADARVPRFGCGRGYWVRFGSPSPTTTYTGAYAFEKPTHGAVIHLKPGWNLIGVPARNAITWNTTNFKVRGMGSNSKAYYVSMASAISSNIIASVAFRHNITTGLYERVSAATGDIHQMVPGEGYWIQVFQECQLILPSS